MARHDDKYYREQADEAQQQADRTVSDVDRASWLRIAQGWLSMIKARPAAKTSEQAFDEDAQKRGTHQNISKDSQ